MRKLFVSGVCMLMVSIILNCSEKSDQIKSETLSQSFALSVKKEATSESVDKRVPEL